MRIAKRRGIAERQRSSEGNVDCEASLKRKTELSFAMFA